MFRKLRMEVKFHVNLFKKSGLVTILMLIDEIIPKRLIFFLHCDACKNKMSSMKNKEYNLSKFLSSETRIKVNFKEKN